MSTKMETIEERKAEVLIKLRKYKLIEKQKYEGAYAYIIDIPQDKEKAIVWCILGEATVGIAAMNTLYKIMKEKELERAIVVTEGRYTHAVKLGAKKKRINCLLNTKLNPTKCHKSNPATPPSKQSAQNLVTC